MRKIDRTFLFVVPAVAVFLATGVARAQTTVVTKKATVTFSGKLDLTMVYRNGEYFTTQKGNGQGMGTDGDYQTLPFVDLGATNAEIVEGTTSTNVEDGQRIMGDHGSEVYLDPNLVLNFSIDVGQSARGVIELRTPFNNPDAGGMNTSHDTGFFSNFQDRTIAVKKLYAEVDEILPPSGSGKGEGLLIRLGIDDFKKDLRGDGNAFIIDTGGSEHPFDSSPTGMPVRYSTGQADSTEAAGGYAQYKFSVLNLDAWFFNLDESYNGLTQFNDVARRDLLFWGASTDIFFDSEKKYGKAFFTIFDLMNESSTHLVTEGGGAVWYPWFAKTQEVNMLEIFGELYFQQGTYSRDVEEYSRIEQGDAYAMNIGAKGKLPPMTFQESKKFIPYAEVSYVVVSGDDDATNHKNSNFVSLENNNRTLVVENGYYGLDIDSNYHGPRFAVGCTLGKFNLELLYAYFAMTNNRHGRAAGSPHPDATEGSKSEKLGDEIDFTIGYEYSANLKFALTNGWLLDSHALGQVAATQITLFQVIMEF